MTYSEFTSSPTGCAIKTLGCGTLGYLLSNFVPVLNTLPNSALDIVIYGAIIRGLGRFAKNHGYDLGIV